MTRTRTNWEPPRGLEHSRPRRVRLTGSGIALLAGVALLLAAAAVCYVLLAKVSKEQTAEHLALRQEGIEVEATVTRLIKSSGESNPRVEYRFASRGVTFEGGSKIPKRVWNNLKVGSSIPVRYARSRPELNMPTFVANRPSPYFLAPLVAGGLIALAGVMIWQLRLQRHLLEDGRPVSGRVTQHKKSDKGTVIHFEYKLLNGAIRSGQSGPMSKPPAIDSSVVVIYDPDEPRRYGLYPMSLVRLDA
jgi:hypothetical protein